MLLVFIFVLGLIVGSFLNVVVYRLSVGGSPFTGRSSCPSCAQVLSVRDLVPVLSFIALRARCRYCHRPVSWQYPLVELATAVSFLLIAFYLSRGGLITQDFSLKFTLLAAYASFLIVIFVYDLRKYLILDSVIVPACILAILGNILLGGSWKSMLLAAVVGAGFFALQFIVSGGRWIGGGDIRLGALMGFMLSWPLVIVALMIAYILGSISGVALILSGTKTLKSKIPFGTFLSFATFLTLLYGDSLLAWYLSLLGLA
ncbi:MAG: prepilin peptidase [Patescibacteria group bacterium]